MTAHTVLVIEDDPGTIAFLRDALEAHGYRVLHAMGEASLALARVEQPAVILLDMRMPEMDDITVSQHLRADPATRHSPIVGISASIKNVPQGALIDAFLEKPFALAALLTTIRRYTAPSA